jgi:hypothetical protein
MRAGGSHWAVRGSTQPHVIRLCGCGATGCERVLGNSELIRDILAEADWDRRQALRKASVGLAELPERFLAATGIEGRDLRSAVKRPEAVGSTSSVHAA